MASIGSKRNKMRVTVSWDELNNILQGRSLSFQNVLFNNKNGNVYDELRRVQQLLQEALPCPKTKKS